MLFDNSNKPRTEETRETKIRKRVYRKKLSFDEKLRNELDEEFVLSELKDFETEEKQETEQQYRINALYNSNIDGAYELAIKLDECSEYQPCNSPACAMCKRRTKLMFIRDSARLWISHYKPLVMMTIVYFDDIVDESDPSEIKIARLKNRLWQQLDNADIQKPINGTFELVFDIENKQWIPHFHLITEQPYKEQVDMLRKQLRKKHAIAKYIAPIQIRAIASADEINVISYAYKYIWFGKKIIGHKKCRLQDIELVYSLLMLDHHSFSELEFLYKVRRTKNGLYSTME